MLSDCVGIKLCNISKLGESEKQNLKQDHTIVAIHYTHTKKKHLKKVYSVPKTTKLTSRKTTIFHRKITKVKYYMMDTHLHECGIQLKCRTASRLCVKGLVKLGKSGDYALY